MFADLQNSSYWQLGAALTSLVKWEALGAVGVILTLAQAVSLANQNARREAAKAHLVLKVVKHELSTVLVLQTIFKSLINQGHDPALIYSADGDLLVNRLDMIEITDLPSVVALEAIRHYNYSLVAMRDICDKKSDDRSVSFGLIDSQIKHLEYYIEMLDREMDGLSSSILKRSFLKLKRGPSPKRPKTALEEISSAEAGDKHTEVQ